MDKKHTPLPWQAKEEFEGWAIVKVGKKPMIGTQYIAIELNQGRDMGESDARFIIEACNSYYQLKEEYNGTVKMLQDTIAEREELKEALIKANEAVQFSHDVLYEGGDYKSAERYKKLHKEIETLLNDAKKS